MSQLKNVTELVAYSRSVFNDKEWCEWARAWLDDKDRSLSSAKHSVAVAAAALVDLLYDGTYSECHNARKAVDASMEAVGHALDECINEPKEKT